ncbi:hypothetical protein LTS07_006424 [Exophiala sideris]|uniref:Phosphatidylinositol N-acetylglucosaminyltransferase subunit H conserved domain-containing protein n=1 Tax=Exophiala sideris TaxID=1016849 RepID=A0ABR0J697_9EURO|nr:hypothetical protein LTS07_006424 [Exophiala sideris]KAK5036024.1 hypothetical protein LTR13_005594 [Exophiala sideris]KAK5057060.1 hypothetical protein LTR69_007698 [Exophiala sideris]KAK5181467.1 hypothetical protein LTR44_006262 [Eurotiomycetes sp. CCFEE 6388]
MFSGKAQYLEVHLPSPTTVSFVVTTRRQDTSKLRSRLLTLFRHVCRIVLVFYAFLINLAKAQQIFSFSRLQTYADLCLKFTLGSSLVKLVADRLEWWIIVPASLFVVYLCLRRDYVEESLLVLQSLGIQTSTSSPYFFAGPTTTFIPTTQIQDIVIHEAFKGLGVMFYLAVIVEGASEVVVVFPTLLPRREILEEVWRGARKCLYSGIR